MAAIATIRIVPAVFDHAGIGHGKPTHLRQLSLLTFVIRSILPVKFSLLFFVAINVTLLLDKSPI
jgi:hypothetical protein